MHPVPAPEGQHFTHTHSSDAATASTSWRPSPCNGQTHLPAAQIASRVLGLKGPAWAGGGPCGSATGTAQRCQPSARCLSWPACRSARPAGQPLHPAASVPPPPLPSLPSVCRNPAQLRITSCSDLRQKHILSARPAGRCALNHPLRGEPCLEGMAPEPFDRCASRAALSTAQATQAHVHCAQALAGGLGHASRTRHAPSHPRHSPHPRAAWCSAPHCQVRLGRSRT